MSALASGDFALCMLADSSPRGGKDWLLSEVYMVRHSDMAALVEAQDEIVELRKQLKELADIFVGRRQGLKDRIRTLSARQQGKIWHHVLPPVALGVGAASLSDKFAAITHAFRIESSSWRDVAKLFSRFLSVTTDYGTEVGLQQVPPLDISTVHPFWQDDDDKDDAIVDDVADGVDAKETRLQQPRTGQESLRAVGGHTSVIAATAEDLSDGCNSRGPQ